MSEHSSHTLARPAPSLAGLRERLAQARYQRAWSQQELADQLGTTPLNVSRWERGSHVPFPVFRAKLSELFGIPLEELGLLWHQHHGAAQLGEPVFAHVLTIEKNRALMSVQVVEPGNQCEEC